MINQDYTGALLAMRWLIVEHRKGQRPHIIFAVLEKGRAEWTLANLRFCRPVGGPTYTMREVKPAEHPQYRRGYDDASELLGLDHCPRELWSASEGRLGEFDRGWQQAIKDERPELFDENGKMRSPEQ